MLDTGVRVRVRVQKDFVSTPAIPAADTGRPGRKKRDQETAGTIGKREGGFCDLLDQPEINAGVPHRNER